MNEANRLYVILFFLFIASPCLAGPRGPAQTELDSLTADLMSFHAQFTQTVKSQDGSVQDISKGEVWLQRPDKLRWVYAGDFPEVIVADGRNVWIYDESLQQVTVKPQSGQASDTPLMILTNSSHLDRQFLVSELGEYQGMDLLELKSRKQDSEFERILLGLKAGDIRMMTLEDAFGQRTEIQFDGVLKNPELDQQLFTFTPPEGADVVGQITPDD